MASVSQRVGNLPDQLTQRELRALIDDIRRDLEALRTALNAHTHSGVTAGGASTGAANASTAPALNTTV